MKFKIYTEKNQFEKKVLTYDNEANVLTDDQGMVFQYQNTQPMNLRDSRPFSANDPLRKSKNVRILKIQLGLSCNYSCDYCSQKFVERAPETSAKDIDDFMQSLDNLQFSEKEGLKVEFWGGEPFVYWKTMKPLAERIAEKFSHWEHKPHFLVITNGSLLTEDICSWLYAMNFQVGISHDGPGQFVRGPDPLEDPVVKQTILDFYKVMRPLGRISFNCMLNSRNISRKEIYKWFVDLTGDENVPLGEGTFVDAYDVDGLENSFTTKKDHFKFRQTAFSDILETQGQIGFGAILEKIDAFTRSILNHVPSSTVTQKCGMDDERILAIDLKGNVITCQNVSSVEVAMNGSPHFSGNIKDMSSVSISTSTHWKNRPDCAKCPVLHICKGSCMFLEDKYWEASCNSSYSDAVSLFAHSIMMITNGYVPYLIESEDGSLPKERMDIWGTTLEHVENPTKKVIKIHESKEN